MKQYPPLIYTYLKKYQENPESRIFAPLAESYRKAGLVDEAIEIAREGLRVHPQFVGGRVALARALFDKKLYQEVIDELTDVAKDVPDNLIAQRLLAESCLMLGHVAEALGAFKMLLYFVPQDAEIVQIVQELESQAYANGALILRTDPADYEQPAQAIAPPVEAPKNTHQKWVDHVEFLQELLQRVAQYRTAHIANMATHIASHID